MSSRLPFATIPLVVAASLISQTGNAQDADSGDVAQQSVFEVVNVVLFNSSPEFGKRAPTPSVVAEFIKRIEAEAPKLWTNAEPEPGKAGLLAVAIRPNGTMRFWVDVDEKHAPELSAELNQRMREVGVPQVVGGPVAFALNFHLFGGPAEPVEGVESVKLPQAWQLAARKVGSRLKVPDEILPLVWEAPSDESKDDHEKSFVPDGFVMQDLRPLGGKILRPNDWIYTEQHRKNTLMWTISKEDPKAGSYETGVRIQFFVGIQKLTGKTPKDFISSFLAQKRKTAKVISDCPETEQGIFTRVCLSTLEESGDKGASENSEKPNYRILYSCFWSDASDMAAVSIAGTTPELWDTYQPIFDTMANVELLDMNKIKPKAE